MMKVAVFHRLKLSLLMVPAPRAITGFNTTVPALKWETFSFRPYSAAGEAAFLAELSVTDWSPLLNRVGPNSKAKLLHYVLEDMVDRHFPMKTVNRKGNDLPWFDNRARRMVKKKAAIYRAEEASVRWHDFKDNLDSYLDKRRENYVERQRVNFTGPNASANFYRNVKAFGTTERPKTFDVRDLCPGLTDLESANKIVDYFHKISREFKPLAPSETYHRQLNLLSEGQVKAMIRWAKKPKSTEKGDIPPALVNPAAPYLAKPVADIYNAIITTQVWPIA